MKTIKKVAILGVGFMGGSLSLAFKKEFPRIAVWGYARSKKSYLKLKKLQILDRVERELKKVVANADLVALALPIESIVDYSRKIALFLKPGAIVFDLGSSKKVIEKSIVKCLPKAVDFVGCHPLVGSEKSGAEFSRPRLYQGAICLITSSPHCSATKMVKRIWERLGAKVIFINADYHDKAFSYLSHLPHIVSFSLIESLPQGHLKFYPQSFKDLTRTSGSPASVWADIFLSNKKNILEDLNKFIGSLRKFEGLIKKKDKAKIIDLIKKINAKQRRWL